MAEISDIMDQTIHAYTEAGLGRPVALCIGRTDIAWLIRESEEWADGYRQRQTIAEHNITYEGLPVFAIDLATGCVAIGERLLEQWRAMGVISKP